DPNQFFVEGVPNRTAEVICGLINRNIAPGTHILTDGHKSYPRAIESLATMTHLAVNHTRGFTLPTGENTNKIEALWSGLKPMIDIKRGIPPGALDDFLIEFRWRRRYKESGEAFIRLIR